MKCLYRSILTLLFLLQKWMQFAFFFYFYISVGFLLAFHLLCLPFIWYFFPCLGFHLQYLIPGAFIDLLTIQCLLSSSLNVLLLTSCQSYKDEMQITVSTAKTARSMYKIGNRIGGGGGVCFYKNCNFLFGWKNNCKIKTVSGIYWKKIWLKCFLNFLLFNWFFLVMEYLIANCTIKHNFGA